MDGASRKLTRAGSRREGATSSPYAVKSTGALRRGRARQGKGKRAIAGGKAPSQASFAVNRPLFYDNQLATSPPPSAFPRGELEITTSNLST